MDRLYDKLCKILEDMDQKKDLSVSDVQIIDWVTHAKKSMLCIEEMEGGYSEDGGGSSRRSYRSSYNGMSGEGGSNRSSRRSSYKRDSMGRYAREGGSYGYSRDGGRYEMIDQLEVMLEQAQDEQTKQSIQKLIRELESK